MGTDRRRVGVVVATAGAALVVGSGFLTWVSVAGSRLSGFRMADLLTDAADRLPEAPPGWTGAAWYLLPLAGALGWVAVFRPNPPESGRAVGLLGLAVVVATAGFLLVSIGERPTSGPVASLAGGGLLMCSTCFARR